MKINVAVQEIASQICPNPSLDFCITLLDALQFELLRHGWMFARTSEIQVLPDKLQQDMASALAFERAKVWWPDNMEEVVIKVYVDHHTGFSKSWLDQFLEAFSQIGIRPIQSGFVGALPREYSCSKFLDYFCRSEII